MRLDEFDYELPPGRIARRPTERRDDARLLVLDRAPAPPRHRRIADLPHELRAGDLLVVNDTRVRSARLDGRKASGGRVELLMLRREADLEGEPERAARAELWQALIDVARPPQVGSEISGRVVTPGRRFVHGLVAN